MDYAKEKAEVERRSSFQFWKVKESGTHKLTFVEEPVKVEREFDGEKKECLRLVFQDDKAPKEDLMVFEPNIGGKSSLAGQIICYGAYKGKLLGETVTVVVKNNGQKNDYTLLEYMDIPKDAPQPTTDKIEKMPHHVVEEH